MLEDDMKVKIVPPYRIKSKSAVGEGEPAKFVPRVVTGLTGSFEAFAKAEAIADFQAVCGRVASRNAIFPQYHEDTLATLPTTHYEFSNGYHASFGVERWRSPRRVCRSQASKHGA